MLVYFTFQISSLLSRDLSVFILALWHAGAGFVELLPLVWHRGEVVWIEAASCFQQKLFL